MRTTHVIKNITISVLSQVVIILLGFLSRKIFIDSLGAEYLGINGLLSNVLSMMVLIEGGIGISITYNLYKPLAEDDKGKITALVQLYKKAYRLLALIIFGISLIIYPFLGKMIKGGQSISNITLVYFIFVAKNMVSYLTSYKWALINADQKGYVLARYNLIFQIITTISKIIVLTITRNYVLYLLIELFIYTVQVLWNGAIVNKRYSYIKEKNNYSIDTETKENITKNVKTMFLHNIGGYLVFGTDNILMSSFVGITSVGLYSNYTMIMSQLSSLLSPILSGMESSVGNLLATEDSEKSYTIFKVMYLINFWIYSFCVIFLYNLLEPFINWWIGEGYLLDRFTFMVILMNFYILGTRRTVAGFKRKAGLFVDDKYAPLIEGIINLVASLLLIKYLGLVGVFLGTTVSTLSIVFWNQPRIVYKKIFNKSVLLYFKSYAFYGILTILTCFITKEVCDFIVTGTSIISLIGKGIICCIIPNILYAMIFYKSEEFKYIINIFKLYTPKIKKKVKKIINILNIKKRLIKNT